MTVSPKSIGRSATLLIASIGFSLTACQSSDLSSQRQLSASAPVTSQTATNPPATNQPGANPEEAIANPETGLPDALANPEIGALPDTSIDTPTNKNDDATPSPALSLANHLTAIGAQMFGAYWCPHCKEQKKKFGDAFSAVDYVECDPGGDNPQTQLCLDNNIEAFPTWVIYGEHHLGAHSLEELAELSGYEGAI